MSLKEELIKSITAASNNLIQNGGESIMNALIENRDENKCEEDGAQQATMTVSPKVTITIDQNDVMEFDCKLDVIRKRKETFVCKFTVNPNQPELGLQNQESNETPVPPPPEADFVEKVVAAGLTPAKLKKYFKGSTAWKDYSGWIAAGNSSEAVAICNDPDRAATFVDLVNSALD